MKGSRIDKTYVYHTERLTHFKSVFLSLYFVPIRADASRVNKEKRADQHRNKLYYNKYNINLYK